MDSKTDKENLISLGKNYCGFQKTKLISIGIIPSGYISIGVVPMGIIAIGIVPMGVISFGLVAMGTIATGLVSMGLITVGNHTMGLIYLGKGNNQPIPTQTEPYNDSLNDQSPHHHHQH